MLEDWVDVSEAELERATTIDDNSHEDEVLLDITSDAEHALMSTRRDGRRLRRKHGHSVLHRSIGARRFKTKTEIIDQCSDVVDHQLRLVFVVDEQCGERVHATNDQARAIATGAAIERKASPSPVLS